jgi:hypothetical protein
VSDQPPPSMSDLPPVPPTAPPVLTWYRVYAAVMAGMYAVVAAYFVVWPMIVPTQATNLPGWVLPVIGACVSLPFLGVYVAALFLPRKRWVWVYHLVLICIGLTSVCCIPVCIPLLIYWLKPETKRYFGREA